MRFQLQHQPRHRKVLFYRSNLPLHFFIADFLRVITASQKH
jgi:hypothetical protein